MKKWNLSNCFKRFWFWNCVSDFISMNAYTNLNLLLGGVNFVQKHVVIKILSECCDFSKVAFLWHLLYCTFFAAYQSLTEQGFIWRHFCSPSRFLYSHLLLLTSSWIWHVKNTIIINVLRLGVANHFIEIKTFLEAVTVRSVPDSFSSELKIGSLFYSHCVLNFSRHMYPNHESLVLALFLARNFEISVSGAT